MNQSLFISNFISQYGSYVSYSLDSSSFPAIISSLSSSHSNNHTLNLFPSGIISNSNFFLCAVPSPLVPLTHGEVITDLNSNLQYSIIYSDSISINSSPIYIFASLSLI